MTCPNCGRETITVHGRCTACGRALPDATVVTGTLTPPPGTIPPGDETRLSGSLDGDLTVAAGAAFPQTGPVSPPAAPTPAPPPAGTPRPFAPTAPPAGTAVAGGTLGGQTAVAGPLTPGQPFGERYHLIRLLGAGGMGAVYQAWDQELDVVVAIKVIRPEAMADPTAARDLERRFKRELLLARNVTHKNVVRIHDLGEINGIKYITMPYVHGTDLATLIKREGKLPVPRALAIAKQIASGLVSAHEAGVVHRDLKPANIMLDEEDKPLITDFGIARSTTGTAGGTIAGAVVGTLEYMAPEQARAEPVDHRADIYALGLIVYDMLAGRRPVAGGGESAVAALMARMTTPMPALRSIDPGIPQAVSDIVARCVALDPAERYQRTQELAAALEGLDANGHPIGSVPTTVKSPGAIAPAPSRAWRVPVPWAAGVLAAVLLISGAYVFRDKIFSGSSDKPLAAATDSLSLAILPFRNATGDPSLDWLGSSIPELLRTQIGQSSRLRTVSPDRLLLRDLQITPDSTLDSSTQVRLAGNADRVLWGQYVKFGNEIQIAATLLDVKTQGSVALKPQAASAGAVLTAVESLAASVRENLFSSAAAKELADAAFRPSSSSIAAQRYFSEGQELARQGRQLEALRKYEAATQEDPNFALAYSRLAQTYSALGYGNEAEKHSRRSASLADSLPAPERQRILAAHARILNEKSKAIEYFEKLGESDDVLLALATLYEETGAYDKARDRFARILARDDKHLDALLGAGRVEIWGGNANGAFKYLTPAQTTATQLGNDEAKATSLRLMGLSYQFQNKLDDALRQHRDALEIERRIGRKVGIAENLSAIARIEDAKGDSGAALRDYRAALDLLREIGDKQRASFVSVDLGVFHASRGKYAEALPWFQEALKLVREIRDESSEAAVLNNIGSIYSTEGRYDEAETYYKSALALYERLKNPALSADALHNLAEISVKSGKNEEALDRYLQALKIKREIGDREGAAYEQHHLGALYERQGRFKAAVDAKADALKAYREATGQQIWLVRVLAGYGSALAQSGRFVEARKHLDEALTLAQTLKDDEQTAQILNLQGDTLFYEGNTAAARPLYQQAAGVAARAQRAQVRLTSAMNLARVDLQEGRAAAAARALPALEKQAVQLRLQYDAIQCSLLAAEAGLATKQYSGSIDRLQTALAEADRLGARVLVARAHYLLSAALRATHGNAAEERRHLEAARQVLQQIRSETGDEVLRRVDLRSMLPEAGS